MTPATTPLPVPTTIAITIVATAAIDCCHLLPAAVVAVVVLSYVEVSWEEVKVKVKKHLA